MAPTAFRHPVKPRLRSLSPQGCCISIARVQAVERPLDSGRRATDDPGSALKANGEMYRFLFPLVIGFAFHAASAFTHALGQRLGPRRGRALCAVFRNLLGIPLWAIGFVLALRAPSVVLFERTTSTDGAAWLSVVAGSLLVISGLWALRAKAAAPSMEDRLVRHGIYGHMRHPIHAGTLLEFVGLVLFMPKATSLLALGVGAVWVWAQTRLEETDLLERTPEYGEYRQQVPCFVPRPRRGRETR
jgi:protein-S-isoprenylcysteine O-methyltransferase Ste14